MGLNVNVPPGSGSYGTGSTINVLIQLNRDSLDAITRDMIQGQLQAKRECVNIPAQMTKLGQRQVKGKVK